MGRKSRFNFIVWWTIVNKNTHTLKSNTVSELLGKLENLLPDSNILKSSLYRLFFRHKCTKVHSSKMPENRVFGFSNRVFGFSNRVFGFPNRVFGFSNRVFDILNRVFGFSNGFFAFMTDFNC